MLRTSSRFRLHRGAALMAACLAFPGVAAADVVAIYSGGERIRLEGAQAAEISRLCVEAVAAAADEGSLPVTDEVRELRASEVVVEVELEEPRPIRPAFSGKETTPAYLLVPLTGERTGPDGNRAEILTGVKKPAEIGAVLGIEVANAPDEYGIVYTGSYLTPGALDPLRRAVAQVGIDAPRPTPRGAPVE